MSADRLTSPQRGDANARAPVRCRQEYLSKGFSLQVLGIFLVGCVRSAIPVRRSKRQDGLAQLPDPAFSKIDREIC